MIIRSDGEARVEVKFHVRHNEDDTLTLEREIVTFPVNGKGVQWRKAVSVEEHLFTIPADQVPVLMERMATGLTFPADGSHV